jgi:hypothetical protein
VLQVHAWATSSASCSDAAAFCSRPKLRLPLDSERQLLAAEAVIAAVYAVPNALLALQQHQLVDAVMLADRIGATAVAEQAVQMLTTAAAPTATAEGPSLTAATVEALASLQAWPACLLPLVLPVVLSTRCCRATNTAQLAGVAAADAGKHHILCMLLAVLGDLEAVWRDEQLQALLMQLPLPALELLLGSDHLRVASEDTVLYTASKLVAAQTFGSAPSFRAALAPLVRARHLSGTALSAQALSSSSSDMLLGSYSTLLKHLISYKLATSNLIVPVYVLDEIAGAPAAWRLGKRQIIATDGVRLVWRLPVEQLAQACKESFAGQRVIVITCADGSPPLGGVSWSLRLGCSPKVTSAARGTAVGLYAVPHEPPMMLGGDTLVVFECSISCHGITHEVACTGAYRGRGYGDFFQLVMSAGGGWDEAAWAAKGLPTSGELEVTLHMQSVGE